MKALVLIALLATACGSASPKPAQPTLTSEPQLAADPELAAEPTTEPAATEPAWDVETQFDVFLGFSEDSRLYAAKTSVGHEEMPGIPEFWINFVEVRELQSNTLVQVFQGLPYQIPEYDQEWSIQDLAVDPLEIKALERWGGLPNHDAALAALATYKIDGKNGKHYVPPSAQLQVRTQGKAPGKTVFNASLSGNSVAFTWKGFTQDVEESAERSPRIQVLDAQKVLFEMTAAYTAEEVVGMADERQPWMDGSISIHYSPDGQYTVFLISEQVHDVHEEMGDMVSRRMEIHGR